MNLDAIRKDFQAASEQIEQALYEHREHALTCYDHDAGWCCVCSTHEIMIPWRKHVAQAVMLAATRAQQ